jgi:uncharacterized damage-inducible protein DinB
VWHLEAHARAFSRNLTKFGEGEVPTKAKLVKAFQQSGKAVEDYLEMRIGKAGHIPSFKRNAVPTLMYFVSHEAHHRGSIMLTIKTSGIKIPETLKWGIWDMFKFRNLTT